MNAIESCVLIAICGGLLLWLNISCRRWMAGLSPEERERALKAIGCAAMFG
jgi:hypothetical protein